MLPEEIINIINKYIYSDSKFLLDLNKNIENIISILRAVNDSMADMMQELIKDSNANNNASELLLDSISLRNYISSIKMLDTSQITNEGDTICFKEEFSEEIIPKPIFDKKVFPYLISDDICPFCNIKILPYTIYYKRIINNELTEETVQWCKCPNCNKMFAIDYNIEDFDFKDTNIFLNKDKYNEIPQIDIYTVIVLSNTMHCSSTHNTKDLIAKIPVINENGEFYYLKINASYCFDCNRFTILKDDFNTIKDSIMCKVIDETTEYQSDNNNDFDIEQKKSVLYQYGYNVQTKRNLSEQQRHIILSSIIEAKIMNRRDVINHITTLIERGSKIKNWNEATNKWKSDRTFVSEYQSDCLPEIIFSNIILKYKSKSK